MSTTNLTIEQARRLEALNSAAMLLVDRSTNAASIFSKGAESLKADGLIGAAAETRDTHITSATLAAIDLAEYVISGPEPSGEIVFDEDGTHLRSDAPAIHPRGDR